ncbi:hypothetical protein F4778DRAFT_618097 [Xylariomycetidae sp. FL2044]|nr:hypothetical protein F4778DRAFT_618097 [Xylariomycetidae sp. FL2044]
MSPSGDTALTTKPAHVTTLPHRQYVDPADCLLAPSHHDEEALKAHPVMTSNHHLPEIIPPTLAHADQEMLKSELPAQIGVETSTEPHIVSTPRPFLNPAAPFSAILQGPPRIAKASGLGKHQAHPFISHHGHVVAYFIVSHGIEEASGVVDSVYKELAGASRNCTIDLVKVQGCTYIRIKAPSQQNASELIQTARAVAEGLTTDQPNRSSSIFIETLPGTAGDATIKLHVDEAGARPHLVHNRDPQDNDESDAQEEVNDDTAMLTETLRNALVRSGRLNTALLLRVHLGLFTLRTFPQNRLSYAYGQFKRLVQNPRAQGRFGTQMDEDILLRGLTECLQRGDGPLVPLGSQTASTANVEPHYRFEAYTDNARFEAKIGQQGSRSRFTADGTSRGGSINETAHGLLRTRTFKQDKRLAELDITNLSLSRELDWKVEAMTEDIKDQTHSAVLQYFDSATVTMPTADQSSSTYPRVLLSPSHAVAKAIKNVAVNKVYQYGWGVTAYVVELAINQRWETIEGMSKGDTPKTDFGISIYGGSWDEDSHVYDDDDTAGNIWGSQLEVLFNNSDSGGDVTSLERVEKFVQMVRNVRDALEDMRDGGK